jgi:hypothetical protein
MAFGIDDAVANASKLIDDAINKIWPNPTDAAAAQATIIKANADAALASLQQQAGVSLFYSILAIGLTDVGAIQNGCR